MIDLSLRFAPGLRLLCLLPRFAVSACGQKENTPETQEDPAPALAIIYSNEFDGPIGTSFPEWTSSPITFLNR